ncbi:4-(cytidine 5'-diphospho)-2-C-methyl-D-erythritol kinase [Dethiothermospora halolimnae]|uniref:4-(cytidine 5'-diphospho)-2-C-methyl-D-erythritol kinase n=1 Tax=Dethiothermospora halolimnae TaxID=3114390 RepID=UPI003CCB9F6D
MEEIKIDAYGKINLSLDVIGKRENGYHELEMVMQQIDLKDTITIKETDKDIIVDCNNRNVPTDSTNLVYKACELIKDKFNINKGAYIYIDKKIPMAAGLAGGSSDAGATLKGLNEMWNLNLNEKELMDIGVKIGADVPYCIMGGTALAKGIGEELTKLNSFSNKLILLANPNIEVSTAYVYNNLNIEKIKEHPNTKEIIEGVNKGNIEKVLNNMVNVLETVTINKYPIIQKVKEAMIKNGALGSLMSGSGPTVFGIFDDINNVNICKDELSEYIDNLFIVKTI